MSFEIGNFVKIKPRNAFEGILDRSGACNTGIVVSVDQEKNIVEVWRDDWAEINNTRTDKVPADQVVLLKDKDEPGFKMATII